MKIDFKKIVEHHKVLLPLAVLLLALVIYQGQRSSWSATFEHLGRLFSYRILRYQHISGTFVSGINAKWHRQEHSLSCEIAALKMALSAQGVDVPESELIQKLDFDPTPRSNGVWGDPYTGFVGDINGKMGQTGYGVYWDPIAKVGNHYRRSDVVRLSSPSDLALHLSQGRPVVSWGYFGRGARINWTTPAGRKIEAVNGEHARTIVGFTGTIENPTAFEVFDPIYGKLSWSTKELYDNWAPFDYMGVVVYPDSRWVKIEGVPTVWEIFSDGTRHALSMDWPSFVSRGGNLAAIKIVSPFELDKYLEGDVIFGP